MSNISNQPEEPVQLSTDEARAGASTHVTRYVLSWGLGLTVVAFIIVVGYCALRT